MADNRTSQAVAKFLTLDLVPDEMTMVAMAVKYRKMEDALRELMQDNITFSKGAYQAVAKEALAFDPLL